MPPLIEIVREHRRAQTSISRKTARKVQAAWQTLDRADLSRSWTSDVGKPIIEAVTAGQYLSVAIAQPYVARALRAQDAADDAAGIVRPSSLAGVATDGRTLAGLMYLPVIATKQSLATGAEPDRALRIGLQLSLGYAITQVRDAGRIGVGVARTATPTSKGWIRVLDPPSCARCAILGGRWYRWNAAFLRHTNCDCTEVPAGRQGSPQDILRELETPAGAFRAGQITGMSAADVAAVEHGADLAQVVNAHRGMYTAGGRRFTREGMTRRGFAGRRLVDQGARLVRTRGGYQRVTIPRPMPEQILLDALDRDDAIRLLKRFGYIT